MDDGYSLLLTMPAFLPTVLQIAVVVFLTPATSTNSLSAFVVVIPSTICAGGLFPSSTGAYTACTYCDLLCVVVVEVVYICVCVCLR